MDGLEFLFILHTDLDLWALPVIVLTAKTLTSDEALALAALTRRVVAKHAGQDMDLAWVLRDTIGAPHAEAPRPALPAAQA